MIELVCGEEKKKFPIKQAEGILYIQGQMRRKGWEIPSCSPYEYKDNALIKRADTPDCREQTKEKPTVKSSKPRAKVEVSHGDDSPKD